MTHSRLINRQSVPSMIGRTSPHRAWGRTDRFWITYRSTNRPSMTSPVSAMRISVHSLSNQQKSLSRLIRPPNAPSQSDDLKMLLSRFGILNPTEPHDLVVYGGMGVDRPDAQEPGGSKSSWGIVLTWRGF